MTSLVPRPAYNFEELEQLYPRELSLESVQILLRHGERSPVSARFQDFGLSAYWPYCNAAKRMSSAIMLAGDTSRWDTLQWRRRLETFGPNDAAVLASGPQAEIDGLCNLGELTDKGRETTLALGQRLRKLYVDQLNFLPTSIGVADWLYLRATPMPRALESVQQCFVGLYPPMTRTPAFQPPTIVTRTPQQETLYPNEANCARLSQLTRAFADRTAARWNTSSEMDYLNHKLAKYMPSQAPVAVDAHPRLSGILDTINSTLAHGPETRLPKDFYDPQVRDSIETIETEEWFAGYKESHEYRLLGVGPLMGDILARMVSSTNGSSASSTARSRKSFKIGLSGCHDTTLAAILSSLGCFENGKWPPYTSHVAIELFKRRPDAESNTLQHQNPSAAISSSLRFSEEPVDCKESQARKPLAVMNTNASDKLRDYYVRVRYNDRPVTIPGCIAPGKHWAADQSFCTLEAFKMIVDKITPQNWQAECGRNLNSPALPAQIERPGMP